MPSATTKPKSSKKNKVKRLRKETETWNGVVMTALIRICASLGFDTAQTRGVCAHAGFKASPSTLGSQMVYGRLARANKPMPDYANFGNGKEVLPKLSQKVMAEIKRVATAIADENEPEDAPKSKPKKEKKAAKKVKKESTASKPKVKRDEPEELEDIDFENMDE